MSQSHLLYQQRKSYQLHNNHHRHHHTVSHLNYRQFINNIKHLSNLPTALHLGVLEPRISSRLQLPQPQQQLIYLGRHAINHGAQSFC